MSKFIDKTERKVGKYAIPHLMNYIIVLYALGLILSWFMPEVYYYYFSLNAEAILHGQVWRIVTFLMQAPNTSIFFFLFSLYLYYFLGSTLERVWGAFKFNLYYFTGVIGTVLAAIVIYLLTGHIYLLDTYYINLSLFLAFATVVPDMQLLLFFIIPVKMKWMAYLDAALLIFEMVRAISRGDIGTVIAILLALANFIFYFFAFMRSTYSPRQFIRRQKFKKSVNQGYGRPQGGYGQAKGQQTKAARHKCAVCGRTELDDENLEFRFCSKCNGNYEYCQDHLFTHTHIK